MIRAIYNYWFTAPAVHSSLIMVQEIQESDLMLFQGPGLSSGIPASSSLPGKTSSVRVPPMVT